MWTKVLTNPINLEVMTNTLPTKGNLVYEYNPFRNYRLSENKYYYNNNYYTLKELLDTYGLFLYYTNSNNNKIIWDETIRDHQPIGWAKMENGNLIKVSESPELYEKGLLIDFITDELHFSLDHPVHIVPLYSYDGSVNLIINDGLNIPRLINSRFSATGKNTYEIIDRKGNNDTNIYDLGAQFDIDTSLYKRIIKIPKIQFNGVSFGGNLKIGNYYFYFKLADADGNETDFVGESGLVSIFIGFNDPDSVHTGQKNENSFKLVEFQLSNIDSAYDNIMVYYSRSTAEAGENYVQEYKKITKKFPINSFGIANLIITGFENTEDIPVEEINLQYNVVDSAATSATCLNMLFMANVHKPNIPYKELSDLSLRFLPFLKQEQYPLLMDLEYFILSTNKGYFDPKYIHDKTGYWPNEIYRLGVVYIMPNNELSPVFNIRGGCDIPEYNENFYSNIRIKNDKGERVYINYNEEDFKILDDESYDALSRNIKIENIKGVCKFKGTTDKDIVYGLDIRASEELISELKKYVKGYFFVRQTRIPTILAQGVTVGIDNEARIPCLPTKGGVINDIDRNNLDKTYLETKDLDGINYISEGFLNRYSFSLKPKGGFLKFVTGLLSAVASVFSFIPGLSTAAAIINAAAFIITTAATGKFDVVSFTTAVISAGVPGLKAVSKSLEAASAVTDNIIKTMEKLQKVNNLIKKVESVNKVVQTFNGIKGTIETAQGAIDMILSSHNASVYNGRNTKIDSGFKKVENKDSRKLSDDFIKRIIIKDSSKIKVLGIICPDYSINLPYYNQIFTGSKHIIKYSKCLGINNINKSNYFSSLYRHFYIPEYYDSDLEKLLSTKIIGVPDNTKVVGLSNLLFRGRAGEAEEAWRFNEIGKKYEDSEEIKENTDIVRGSFSSYLAVDTEELDAATLVDIMIPGYSDTYIEDYFYIRMIDSTPFFAISFRYDINDLEEQLVSYKTLNKSTKDGYKYELFRGDCYLCQYTLRINRNFNDPSAPYNDKIVDENSWKDNFDPDNTEKYVQINLGDVNAVPLGMWLTFKLRSSNNLNIRTLDGSNVDESAMTGHERGYFPYFPMSTEGSFKHSDSEVYNKGFTKSVGERWNFELPDVPHIKNWFGTRIMYSDIHINDAYKNGFRVFLGTHYRDYTRNYGEIVKLIPFESSLLCIFEHGIALIPVNERAVAGQGSGGNVYINTSNVLPENPKIISDNFGSQWPESVLKVPGRTGDAPQYVYGVDTVAKKIWRTDGNSIECISDFKVQEFLNNNITLGERELTPIIGIRNVKTHYNAFKRDVMFTFYDNTYGFEEKVWNLCWNELLQKFVTFYSWVPSYMENINNIPFSFNRDTSKWVAKLGVSHKESSFADGITLTNVIIDDTFGTNGTATNNTIIPVEYITKLGETKIINVDVSKKVTYPAFNGNTVTREEGLPKFIAGLSLSNRILPDSLLHYRVDFSLERDSYGNHKLFRIIPLEKVTYRYSDQKEIFDTLRLPEDAMFPGAIVPIYALCFNDDDKEYFEVYYLDNEGNFLMVLDENNNNVYTHKVLYSPEALYSELYYRNAAGNVYADYDDNKLGTLNITNVTTDGNRKVWYDLPIFKDITGKRPTLPKEEQVNPDKLVTLLNIKATISILDTDNKDVSMDENYYNMKASYASGTSLIDAGHYESTVAIAPKWNMQFLSTDFWKHGLAGLIDIADDIYPTYWYGKQHPFEFECIVVNDPSTHKIFLNLELVANKAKPESFHYEVIGESYDFAKDKVNMYFRLEAMKALWLYNGADICYDRNFLKVQPRQLAKSADLPHTYYTRQDTINDVEDYYINITYPKGYDYRHLSGGEITYYPNRQEYRVWNHAKAISLDDLSLDDSRSIIAANCKYLEDRWKITINPILVCYKNEYLRKFSGSLIQPQNSVWTSPNRPKLPVMNSPIPDKAYLTIVDKEGIVEIPKELTNLGYTLTDMDTSNWLNDVGIYKTSFGEALNRKELDLKDKFMKVRIRYSGEELAVIDFLNTIYRISYA